MKVYISLPISGHSLDACKRRANEAKAAVESKGHTVITPFDVCPGNKPYAYCMGKDIQALLDCDAIYLLSGWSESNGCRLEWQCALIYHKAIYQHLNQIPNPH